MTVEKEEKSEFRARDRWLLLSLFAGPLSVLANVAISYSLVPTACESGTKMLLYGSSVAFLLVTVAAAFTGRHYLHLCNASDAILPAERTRWTSVATLYLSIGSALAIVATALPNMILGSCS
jgi:hypothetical protein